MKQTVIALSALFLSVILYASGNAFVASLLGVRLSLAGHDPMVIGAVLFFFALGFVIGTQHAQKIIQRVGHIRAFAVFAAAIAIATLIYPMTDSMVTWSALRFASGIASAGLLIAVESWFSCVATENNRGALFATYQVFFFLAVVGGQLLLQVAPPDSMAPFSIAAILLVAALIPLAVSHMHSPVLEAVEALPFSKVFGESPLGIIAAIISGILMSSFYAMGPVYATGTGLSVDQTARFMALSIFSAMLLAWPIGHVCDRHDRARVLLLVTLVAMLSSAAVALIVPLDFALIATLTALYVGLSASIYPIAVAITNDRMTNGQIVSASATLLLAYGLGSLVGPLLNAGVMSLSGANGFFMVNASVLLALIAYILRDMHRVPASTVEEQENYVAVMPGVVVTSLAEIDPRNEEFDESAKTLDDVFIEPDTVADTQEASSGT